MMKITRFICTLLIAFLCWQTPVYAESADEAQKNIEESGNNLASSLKTELQYTKEALAYTWNSSSWLGKAAMLCGGVLTTPIYARHKYAEHLEELDACKADRFKEKYKGTEKEPKCFTCRPVSFVITSFLEGCAKSYPVMRAAGKTILLILTALWIAYHFLLAKIISFSEIDPMEYLQELFTFLFKVLIAYVCLGGGLSVLMKYTMNPIISFGTSMGIGFLGSLT